MSELSEFLLARIAEDEAAAGGAFRDINDGSTPDKGKRWWNAGDVVLTVEDNERIVEQAPAIGDDAVASHIARHDPARVLAECKAKRRIVEAVQYLSRLPSHMCMPDVESAMGLERAMQAMAAVYADHPDYRSEWAL